MKRPHHPPAPRDESGDRDPAEGGSAADAAGAERQAEAGAEAAAGAPSDVAPAAPGPEQQIAELQDRWLRARAELENVRRAARLDVEQARRYGASPVLLALVGVLDNLQRALAQAPPGLDEDFLHGLRLTEQQFLAALAAAGVSVVPAEPGQPFDPRLHRAIHEQPSSDVPAGAILHVAAPGYRLHDRLLRDAQVVVARSPDAGPG